MTTATTWRKERGRETERLLAAWFRERGWPYAEPVGAGRPGADITGMPGLVPEIKATRTFSPHLWLRQGASHAAVAATVEQGCESFVIWRPDGMGPAQIIQWPVLMELEPFTWLLRAAGYGDDDRSERKESDARINEQQSSGLRAECR